MTNNVLKAMKGAMQEMGMEYAFRRFRKRPEYPYCVGDYLESESMTEDGLQECTFTLTGFARGAGSETVLEAAKNKIRNYFTLEVRAFPFDDGSVVAIAYGDAQPVPTEDAELDRIQINLTVKEWSVS